MATPTLTLNACWAACLECQNLGAARGLAMNSRCCRRVYRDRPVRAGKRHGRKEPYAHAVVYHEAVGILLAHPAP